MRALKHLNVSKWPWRIIKSPIDRGIDGIVSADDEGIVETDSGFYPPSKDDAALMVESPVMYEALFNLVNEIEKVLDHTAEGYAVIDCECSGIECAAAEAREILDRISEKRETTEESKGD